MSNRAATGTRATFFVSSLSETVMLIPSRTLDGAPITVKRAG
jgi:hypothetical protein